MADINKNYRINEKGIILRGEDEYNEAIENIITTRPGERVFNRGFGSGLWQYLFEPMTEATASRIRLAIVHDLYYLENRFDVNYQDVKVVPVVDQKQYDITVRYTTRYGGLGEFRGSVQSQ